MYLDLWGTREQGEQWMRRESEAGLIERVGSVMRYDRWENAYARGHRPQQVFHDHLVTDLVIMLEPTSFTCQQADKTIGADIELWFGEQLWYGELHRATGQTVAELERERFTRYESVTEPVLWVVEGGTEEAEKRRMAAMLRSPAVTDRLYFCTYTDLIQRTEEPILINRKGEARTLPDG